MASLRAIVPTSPPAKEFKPHFRSAKRSTKEKIDKLVNEGTKNYPAYLKLIYTGDSDFSDNVSSEDEEKKRHNEVNRLKLHRKSRSLGSKLEATTLQNDAEMDSNKLKEARMGKENSADGLCNIELGDVSDVEVHNGIVPFFSLVLFILLCFGCMTHSSVSAVI